MTLTYRVCDPARRLAFPIHVKLSRSTRRCELVINLSLQVHDCQYILQNAYRFASTIQYNISIYSSIRCNLLDGQIKSQIILVGTRLLKTQLTVPEASWYAMNTVSRNPDIAMTWLQRSKSSCIQLTLAESTENTKLSILQTIMLSFCI